MRIADSVSAFLRFNRSPSFGGGLIWRSAFNVDKALFSLNARNDQNVIGWRVITREFLDSSIMIIGHDDVLRRRPFVELRPGTCHSASDRVKDHQLRIRIIEIFQSNAYQFPALTCVGSKSTVENPGYGNQGVGAAAVKTACTPCRLNAGDRMTNGAHEEVSRLCRSQNNRQPGLLRENSVEKLRSFRIMGQPWMFQPRALPAEFTQKENPFGFGKPLERGQKGLDRNGKIAMEPVIDGAF